MTLRLLRIFLFIITSISIQSFAQSFPATVRIEGLDSKGNGCPPGSVSWTLAPDSSAISFLFDRYSLQGPYQNMNQSCQLRFLLWYPKNYRLKIVGVDYRGMTILPNGANSVISTQIIQTISRMARTIDESTHRFQGPLEQELLISRATSKGDWMSCNGVNAMNYLFKTQIQVTNPTGVDALLQIDSADIDVGGGISMKLAWEKCN